MKTYDQEVKGRIAANGENEQLRADAAAFMKSSLPPQYSYNFSWLGRPIIQYPQDMVAMQEVIWTVQPDIIIETGIAHGGSLIFSASLLELNAACGGPQDARVVGIDIDIRPHNRAAIEVHPMMKRITMIQGSSIAPEIVAEVKALAAGKRRILVCLDSNHTHDHVLAELEAYAPLTTVGSYCVVFDTVVEDTAECCPSSRPWGKGNNPKTAAWQYLKTHPEFEIDTAMDNKLLISVAPSGYLKRVA
jgi:cephalosporin hydroxylase